MEYKNWKKSISQAKKDMEVAYNDYQCLIREVTKQGINVLGAGGGLLENKCLTVDDYSLMDELFIDERFVEKDYPSLEYNLIAWIGGNFKYKKSDGSIGKVRLFLNKDFDKLAKVVEKDVDYHKVHYGPTWKRSVNWREDLEEVWESYLKKGVKKDLILNMLIEVEKWNLENPRGEIDLRGWTNPPRFDYLGN